MSHLSNMLETLRSAGLWEEALERSTVILPDASDDSYWPMRRFVPEVSPRGVLWLVPEFGLHGAWYLLNASAACGQGFIVYIPERRGRGLHPAPFSEERQNADWELLEKYFGQWHPDLKAERWVPVCKQAVSKKMDTESFLSCLNDVDTALQRGSASLEAQKRRAALELMSTNCVEALVE